ncbi:MAG: transporter substrate-binding domain-containing protein [Reyranellaceae bacterium]
MTVFLVALAALGPPATMAQPQGTTAQPRPRPATPAQRTKPGQKPPAAPAIKATVVTEGRYPPFNMLDAQGRPAGFEVDLAAELCKRAKVDCRIVTAAWDDILPGLLDKRYDAIMASMIMTSERRRQISFSKRYMLVPGAFVSARSAAVPDGAPALLRGKTVGVQRGTVYADYLDRAFRKAVRMKQFPTADAARKELAAGKLDAVLGDKVALWQWLKTPDGACCDFFGQDIKDRRTMGDGVGIGFRKDDAKLRDLFNKALAEVVADGTLKRIAEKYVPFAIY